MRFDASTARPPHDRLGAPPEVPAELRGLLARREYGRSVQARLCAARDHACSQLVSLSRAPSALSCISTCRSPPLYLARGTETLPRPTARSPAPFLANLPLPLLSPSSPCQLYLCGLPPSAPAASLAYEPLLLALSDAYEGLRAVAAELAAAQRGQWAAQVAAAEQAGGSCWVPPDTFRRCEMKWEVVMRSGAVCHDVT
jgi:hypothetical protein